MIRARFHRAASAESEAAIRWYNGRVTGLGDDFRREPVAGVERLIDGPMIWPVSAYDLRARRFLLSGFPYSIVYMVDAAGDITVVAIAHAKRRPGYWRRRIGP